MNFEPVRNFAAQAAETLNAAMAWFAPAQTDTAASLLAPALAGIAAAILVALVLALLSRARYGNFQAMIRRGLAVAIAMLLLAFAAYDIHNAAHADLRAATAVSTGHFDLNWHKATERAREIAAEMDRLPGARRS